MSTSQTKANDTCMGLVGVDWLKSDKREGDLGSRPGGIVQFQISISSLVQLVISLLCTTQWIFHWKNVPLLKKFVDGGDEYRNSRFKLIPFTSEGSWIVKQSVGRRSCLIGQSLEINYSKGRNYIEILEVSRELPYWEKRC